MADFTFVQTHKHTQKKKQNKTKQNKKKTQSLYFLVENAFCFRPIIIIIIIT